MQKIKSWILNRILTEQEKVIIIESLKDREYLAKISLGESAEDLISESYKIRKLISSKYSTFYDS